MLLHENVAPSRCHIDPSLPVLFATIPLACEMSPPLKGERGRRGRGRRRERRRRRERGRRREERRKEEGIKEGGEKQSNLTDTT